MTCLRWLHVSKRALSTVANISMMCDSAASHTQVTKSNRWALHIKYAALRPMQSNQDSDTLCCTLCQAVTVVTCQKHERWHITLCCPLWGVLHDNTARNFFHCLFNSTQVCLLGVFIYFYMYVVGWMDHAWSRCMELASIQNPNFEILVDHESFGRACKLVDTQQTWVGSFAGVQNCCECVREQL